MLAGEDLQRALLLMDPKDFERLCVAILEAKGHCNVRHWGAIGRDGGYDIVSNGPDGRTWVVQCKRVQAFTPEEAKDTLVDIIKNAPDAPPEVMLLAATCGLGRRIEPALKKGAELATFDLEIATPWDLSWLSEYLAGAHEIRQRFLENLYWLGRPQATIWTHAPSPPAPENDLSCRGRSQTDATRIIEAISKLPCCRDPSGVRQILVSMHSRWADRLQILEERVIVELVELCDLGLRGLDSLIGILESVEEPENLHDLHGTLDELENRSISWGRLAELRRIAAPLTGRLGVATNEDVELLLRRYSSDTVPVALTLDSTPLLPAIEALSKRLHKAPSKAPLIEFLRDLAPRLPLDVQEEIRSWSEAVIDDLGLDASILDSPIPLPETGSGPNPRIHLVIKVQPDLLSEDYVTTTAWLRAPSDATDEANLPEGTLPDQYPSCHQSRLATKLDELIHSAWSHLHQRDTDLVVEVFLPTPLLAWAIETSPTRRGRRKRPAGCHYTLIPRSYDRHYDWRIRNTWKDWSTRWNRRPNSLEGSFDDRVLTVTPSCQLPSGEDPWFDHLDASDASILAISRPASSSEPEAQRLEAIIDSGFPIVMWVRSGCLEDLLDDAHEGLHAALCSCAIDELPYSIPELRKRSHRQADDPLWRHVGLLWDSADEVDRPPDQLEPLRFPETT